MAKENNSNIQVVYDQLCESYWVIDDFRVKLLGFLPLATGVGVSLIVAIKEHFCYIDKFLLLIGLFGSLITLGLFCYELFGIKKCTYIIKARKN